MTIFGIFDNLAKEANIMHGSKLNPEATADYIQSFSAKILDKFYAQKSGISGQEIVKVSPIKQVNFFVLKVLFDQWQEETKKFKSPFFNYKNESVNSSLKNLINVLSKNILIERDAFEPLFKQATEQTLLLMYQPADFYKSLLENITKTDKIKELKVASKYIKIGKSLFEELIAGLEKSANSDRVNLGVIDAIIQEHQIDQSELNAVEKQFSTVVSLDGVVEITPTSGEKTETGFDEKDTTGTIGLDEDRSELEKFEDQFEPLESSPSKKEVEDVSVDSVNELYSKEIETVHHQYHEKTESVGSKLDQSNGKEILSTISVNQRYMFVNDLFDNDTPEFEIAITEIEGCDSFDDAVEMLVQKYSRKFSWDMNSDEVKELLKVIFKRFR